MVHPVPTDIIQLLKQLTNLLQPFAKSHNIVLVFKPKPKNLVLLFRPDLLIVDMTNLLCNIISYMPPGNRLTVTVYIDEKELKIQVNNTGINLSLVSEITMS